MEPGYAEFRKRVLSLTGWDLDCYKSQQLERRLRALQVRTRVRSLSEYATLLEKEPSRLRELSDLLTINVTEFFRNPDRFSYLERHVLPSLRSPAPSVWSAGCSNGSEAYTLAMLFEEAGTTRYSILATDIDPGILDAAKRATYTKKEMETVPAALKAKYWSTVGEDYVAKDVIRDRVRFQRHNLLSDTYPRGFDLIVCRNVLIYFTESAKDSVISRFHKSLRPGGYLFVGSTETIFNSAEIGFSNLAPFFYQKPGGTAN